MPNDTDFIHSSELGAHSPLDVAISERDRDAVGLVRHAVQTRNAMLAFQPVVQAARPDHAAYYEGMIRLRDTTGRIIPPSDFVDAVENSELGRQVDCLALELGLAELAAQPSLRLAVNMSARSIGYPRWMKTLREGLAHNETIAERLILEISESSAMMMPDLVSVFMEDLQTAGVSFALDAFGAGFTSFRNLREFFFDIVKIDGEFIEGIADNPDNQVLTEALMSIAQHFEMFTVALTVQNERDAAFLTAIGIDCMQGYHFGAPSFLPPWKVANGAKMRA